MKNAIGQLFFWLERYWVPFRSCTRHACVLKVASAYKSLFISARRAATGESRAGEASRAGDVDQGWKVRSATDRTIRTFAHQNSVKILSEFRIFFTILQKLWKCWDLSTFSRKFGEIQRKNHQNQCKFRWKLLKNHAFCRNWCLKFEQKLENVWRIFANILNLERCEGMFIL